VTEFITMIPWACLLFVVGMMGALQWRALSALDDLAKLLAQLLGQWSSKAGPLPLPAQPASAPAKPTEAPKQSGPFASSPPWFQWALHEIGFHETGNNGGIGRYIDLSHCGAVGDPWCAIFANAMLEQSSIAGTRSASSQSFRTSPAFVQLSGPAPGAIVVFWRGAQDSGLGHVGFYRGEDASRIWTLGGNENDMVQIEALPKQSASFGLIGYWWPKSVPLPAIGAVMMPTGSPVNVQVPPDGAPAAAPMPAASPGRQTNITATMFGGPKSAYGGPIDDNRPGCALPHRFVGERPQVKVTAKRSGVSIVCDIVDVGPWNINDPYWTTGARPQAETRTDMTGRHTNGAGIDLTLAAAKALQIDGKGLVDWEFVQSPLPPETQTQTKVT
jgi:uncharacterized protein (TIGR02594 family)